MEYWIQYIAGVDHFGFMDESEHIQEFQQKKTGAQKAEKAKLARQAFRVGVGRVKELVQNKEKLKEFKQELDQMYKEKFKKADAAKVALGLQGDQN
jgi:hypothetical protein